MIMRHRSVSGIPQRVGTFKCRQRAGGAGVFTNPIRSLSTCGSVSCNRKCSVVSYERPRTQGCNIDNPYCWWVFFGSPISNKAGVSLLHSLGSKVAIFWGRKKHIFLIISDRTDAGYGALTSHFDQRHFPYTFPSNCRITSLSHLLDINRKPRTCRKE